MARYFFLRSIVITCYFTVSLCDKNTINYNHKTLTFFATYHTYIQYVHKYVFMDMSICMYVHAYTCTHNACIMHNVRIMHVCMHNVCIHTVLHKSYVVLYVHTYIKHDRYMYCMHVQHTYTCIYTDACMHVRIYI